MSLPTYPSENKLRVLAGRLAKIAEVPKVPIDRRGEFCENIVQTVLSVRNRDRRSTGQIVGGRLSEAANATRGLQNIYSRLSQQDRNWVEHINRTQMQFEAGKIQNIESTISNLSMLFHSALGKASPVPKPPKFRGGAPNKLDLYKQLGMLKPRVKDQMLRELVFGLLRAAQEACGKFDFNKNSESGALAETLRLLRDGSYLPPGLVPDPLPASTIQRLKDEFSRLTS